jgi:hypothetical protein
MPIRARFRRNLRGESEAILKMPLFLSLFPLARGEGMNNHLGEATLPLSVSLSRTAPNGMRNRILRYLRFLGVQHQRKWGSGKGLNRSKRRKRRDDPLSSDEGIENTNCRQNRMRELERRLFLKCPIPREGGARG